MAWFAQRNAVKQTEEFFLQSCFVATVDIEQERHLDQMVNFYRSITGLAHKAAALAGVVVPYKTSKSPLFVLFSFADPLPYFSNTASPIPVLRALPGTVASGLAFFPVGHFGSVSWKKFRDSLGRVVKFRDHDHGIAAAVAKVLPLIRLHPFVNALVMGGYRSIRVLATFAFSESTKWSAVEVNAHGEGSYSNKFGVSNKIKRSSKSGELLETLSGNTEGNQQPSRQYTAGRFRDYWSGQARLITRIAPDPQAKRDDIVRARRNAGSKRP